MNHTSFPVFYKKYLFQILFGLNSFSAAYLFLICLKRLILQTSADMFTPMLAGLLFAIFSCAAYMLKQISGHAQLAIIVSMLPLIFALVLLLM